jgi:hypothetical protein
VTPATAPSGLVSHTTRLSDRQRPIHFMIAAVAGTGSPPPGARSRCPRCLPGLPRTCRRVRDGSGQLEDAANSKRVRCRPGRSYGAAAWPYAASRARLRPPGHCRALPPDQPLPSQGRRPGPSARADPRIAAAGVPGRLSPGPGWCRRLAQPLVRQLCVWLPNRLLPGARRCGRRPIRDRRCPAKGRRCASGNG